LKYIAGNLFEPQADGVTIQRLESENLQKKQIQSALNQIGRLAHAFTSVTESTIHKLLSVSKGKIFEWRPIAAVQLNTSLKDRRAIPIFTPQ
jgi:hypothetical protein